MENRTFVYNYSADRSREVERIRNKYLPKQETPMERLKRLDRKAQTAGQIPALTIGVIGCLIFGIGMCFGLDVFAGSDWLTVIFCALGALIMAPVYPLYKKVSKSAKERLTPEILRLTEEIIGHSENAENENKN